MDKDEGLVQKIKEKLSLVEMFKNYGANLKKTGTNGEHNGLCIFHKEKTPSLFVNETKGTYHCFGCGKKGDALSLVQEKEGLGFAEALKYLTEKYSGKDLNISMEQEGLCKAMPPAPPPKIKHSEEIDEDITLNKTIDYYHKRLYDSKKAPDYLKKRGIKSPEIYSRFSIGYVDGSLQDKIGKIQKSALKRLGIIRSSGLEHFTGCLVFPIFDDFGIVKGIYGRSINNKAMMKHLYLKGNHKGVFNRRASKVYPDQLILTECIIDCLSLIELGIENVQSVYGVNGFTDEHLQLLKEDRVKMVVLAFDNDEAGKKAAEDLKTKLILEGFQVKIIFPSLSPLTSDPSPVIKDWNESLLKGIKKEEIQDLINQAEAHGQSDKNFSTKEEKGFIYFTIHDLIYRLSGVKEIFITNLKVTIKAQHHSLHCEPSLNGAGQAEYQNDFFVDTVDLCSYRSRSTFSSHLSNLFGIESKRVEKDLLAMLEYLELQREKKLSTEEKKKESLTEEEKELGMRFLKSPNLFQQIIDDMSVLGYVGEDLNKQLMYLCASSRKMDDPISVLITSQSASGKSMLVDTVRKLIPSEEVVSATSLSDQALNYINDLSHKFLIFGESVHNEIIEHQIREMLSSKELSRLVTVKNDKTGELSSKIIKKKVIVASVISTTSHRINPENASRSFLINTDESKEQTKRIYEIQRKKYSKERHQMRTKIIPGIIKKHHSAQKLLRKPVIVNPFAEYLDFPTNLMRLRRDHDRFIDLIAVVCFLRQYQKKVKSLEDHTQYIECDFKDYEIAREIMIKGVLSATLSEIPKGAIMLYEEIREMVKEKAKKEGLKVDEVSFSQREAREFTEIGADSARKYIRQLVIYEYLDVVARGKGKRYAYRLIADESINDIDFTVIPTVAIIRKKFKNLGNLGTT